MGIFSSAWSVYWVWLFLAMTPNLFAAIDRDSLLQWRSDSLVTTDSALEALQARGYWSAYRLPATTEQLGKIEAGELFRLDSLKLQSTALLPDLEKQLAGFRGLAASLENLQALRATLEQSLRQDGFPFASFTFRPADQAAGSLRPPHSLIVVIAIQAGDGFKLGGFLAQQTRTHMDVLLRLSLLEYGETLNEGRLAQALARLRRWGYYDAVDSLGWVRDPRRNLIFPILRLADYRGNRVGGLLGFDSEAESDQLSGFVDVHLINIRGTARDFDFKFESRPQSQGRSDREASLVYVEPWLPGLPLGLRVTGSVWLQDSVYNQIDGGLALLKDIDFHSRLELTVSRQYSHDILANRESEAFSGGLGLVIDARDQVPFPLNGARLDARISGIRRDIGDSSRFLIQSRLHAEAYLRLSSHWLLHTRVESGGNWPRHPLAERGDRFEVGGARSLRGYREREFSTDLFGYADTELQWLLAGQGRLLFFASPGLINKQESSVWWRRVIGYGAGFELGSKAWAVGLIYALNPDRPWAQGLLHMTVENRF